MKKTISLLMLISALAMNVVNPSHRALAQVTGGVISGTVRNQAQEPLVGVKVTILNQATNQTRTTVTDEEGAYRLPALAVGQYEITMEAESYQKRVLQVTLRVNEEARLDAELTAVGSSEETTIVASSAPLTESSNSVLGLVIENKQINDLPLNGRNFLQLGTLVANVSSTASLRGGSEGGIANGPFAVAGQRDRSSTFLVDGLDNNSSQSNSLLAQVSLDAIQEFKMITNLGAAEFGTRAGGMINIITKSGANDFHFTAFEFFREEALNAPNAFAKLEGHEATDFLLNQFGGTLSGPLIKDRTFFLGNVEFQRLHVGNSQFATVPTVSQRAGIFRHPTTGQTVQLPVDPVAAEILRRYVPLPNSDSEYGNFFSSPRLSSHNNFALFRLDHLVSGDGVLNARYFYAENDTVNPMFFLVFGSSGTRPPTIPGFGAQDTVPAHSLALSYTHTFSVERINDVRFGYTRTSNRNALEDSTAPTALGFVGVNSPTGLFDTNIAGITRLGNGLLYPLEGRANNFHLVDNFSWLRGRHAMKFGGEARWLNQQTDAARAGSGALAFSGAVSGISALADFVLGVPVAGVLVERNLTAHTRQMQTGFFWQDDYQVSRHLVLNYGLRYELATVVNSPTHDYTNFSIARGFYTPGVDTDTGLYKGDHNNFAPRFGFAWSLNDSGNTVVRGGYGVFYDTVLHSHLLVVNANQQDNPWVKLSFAPRGPGRLGNIFDPATLRQSPAAGLTVYDENLRTPYAQHINFNVQRELWRTSLVSFGYVGTKTTKLITTRNINQAIFLPGTDASGRPLSTAANVLTRRPTQLYGLTDTLIDGITQFESAGSATYHSLQATFSRRLSRGLSLLSAYTWSKSIDNATDPVGFTGDGGGAQNSYDTRSERALSVFDIRHRFTLACTYLLPIGGNRWLDGWQLNALTTMQSGQPFTPILGFDPTLTGSTGARPNYIPGAFINEGGQLSYNPALAKDPRTGIPLSLIPAPGQFGTLGRNTFTGPSYRNFDLSLIKDTRVNEKLRLQTRFEVFNLFNTTNLALPERRMLDPFFGRSTRTQDVAGGLPGLGGGGPRVAQIALRLSY